MYVFLVNIWGALLQELFIQKFGTRLNEGGPILFSIEVMSFDT